MNEAQLHNVLIHYNIEARSRPVHWKPTPDELEKATNQGEGPMSFELLLISYLKICIIISVHLCKLLFSKLNILNRCIRMFFRLKLGKRPSQDVLA